LYIPTLILGAQTVTRAIEGDAPAAALTLLAGLTLLTVALVPFAASMALRANLR